MYTCVYENHCRPLPLLHSTIYNTYQPIYEQPPRRQAKKKEMRKGKSKEIRWQ